MSIEKARKHESMFGKSNPNYKHGMADNHPLFKVWANIKAKCNRPTATQYEWYGARGINVCDEWLSNFKSFYDHVTQLENYGKIGYTLDRINNNGNYKPGNLRWASKHTQTVNRRKFKSNTTGFTGVYVHKEKFIAGMRINRQYIHIGIYSTIIEAAEARNNYIIKHGLFEYPIQQTLVA